MDRVDSPAGGAQTSVATTASERGPPTLAAGPLVDTLLAVPNRRRIHDDVVANPGIAFRELTRAARLAVGTVRHHLNVLIRNGRVVERRHGRRVVFFDARLAEPSWRRVAVLRNGDLRVLLSYLDTAPGSNQRAIVAAMAGQGWNRTTTQHRLARLELEGLVRSAWQSRSKRYWPCDAAEGLPAAAPSVAGPSPLAIKGPA